MERESHCCWNMAFLLDLFSLLVYIADSSASVFSFIVECYQSDQKPLMYM
jgi:hypothetical protein